MTRLLIILLLLAALLAPAANVTNQYSGQTVYSGLALTTVYYTGGGSDSTTNGITLWTRMNAGSGTTAVDSSGNGLTLYLSNSVPWVTGVSGSALAFTNSSAVANYGTSSLLNLTNGSYTIDFWIKSTNANFGFILNRTSGVGTAGWETYLQGGKLIVRHNSAGGISTPGTINDGNWHNIALVNNGGSVTIWDNLTATTNATLTQPTNTSAALVVNHRAGETDNPGLCTLDGIMIYAARALSPSELTNIYNAPATYASLSAPESLPEAGPLLVTAAADQLAPTTQPPFVSPRDPQYAVVTGPDGQRYEVRRGITAYAATARQNGETITRLTGPRTVQAMPPVQASGRVQYLDPAAQGNPTARRVYLVTAQPQHQAVVSASRTGTSDWWEYAVLDGRVLPIPLTDRELFFQ